jgi:hypothetical protein
VPTSFFKDLYDEAESGSVGASVPEGTYDVAVVESRAYAESSLIFLTLQVLNGPAAGKQSDVNLYFPGEGSKRGAHLYFTRKIAGLASYPDVKSAFQAADGAPSAEAGFELIADALIGKQIVAEIGLRTDGDYAGSNELRSTKPMASPLSQAPVAAPAPETTPATLPPQAVNDGNAKVEVPF